MTGEKRSTFPIEDAVELYVGQHKSLQEIAQALHVDRITVRRHLLDAHVTLRAQGGAHRKNGANGHG